MQDRLIYDLSFSSIGPVPGNDSHWLHLKCIYLSPIWKWYLWIEKFRKHSPKACAPLGTTELLAFLNNTKKDVQKHDTLTKIRFSFKRPRNAERRRIS